MKRHHAALQMAKTIRIDARHLALKIDILLPDPGHETIQDPPRRRPLSVYPTLKRLKTLQHQSPYQFAEGVCLLLPQILHPLCYAHLCSVEGVHHIKTCLYELSEVGQVLERQHLIRIVNNKEDRL